METQNSREVEYLPYENPIGRREGSGGKKRREREDKGERRGSDRRNARAIGGSLKERRGESLIRDKRNGIERDNG